jgi:hypothetical protein
VAFIRRSVFAVLSLLPVLSGCGHGARPPAPVGDTSPGGVRGDDREPVVSTLAGDGRMGVVDGDERDAAFLFPYAIAVAPDGSLYVSDAGARTIRRIADGKVTTVAGFAPPGLTAQARAGGYKDGPAPASRFLWPTGLAVAPDGSLFIADSGNHCIRRLKGAVVTTFAGTCLIAGKRDGLGLRASFAAPQSLAFDDAGYLYVADFGNGIRRISPGGIVTTLKLPSNAGRVLSVSTLGAGPSLRIAYSEDQTLHLWSPARHQTVAATAIVEPAEDNFQAAGSFDGVVLLNAHTVAVTDVLHDVVRLVRFGTPPFSTFPDSRVIAGLEREADGAPGGFADGPASGSRIDVPLAIARMPDGTLVFSDAGNRRVRAIANVDARGPVAPDLAGLYGPSADYRVTIVGDSFAFSNVLWPESIAGRVEAGLRAGGSLARPPFVSTVRLDGATISQQASFVREHLGDGQTDLVIMLVDDITQSLEIYRANGTDWRTLVPARLRALQNDLAKRGTQLMVVLIPSARSVSPAEVPDVGTFNDGYVSGLSFEQDSTRAHELERIYLGMSGIRVLALQEAMERFEEGPHRFPLFNMHDIHLSPQGATWVGDAVAGELNRLKPWANVSSP